MEMGTDERQHAATRMKALVFGVGLALAMFLALEFVHALIVVGLAIALALRAWDHHRRFFWTRQAVEPRRVPGGPEKASTFAPVHWKRHSALGLILVGFLVVQYVVRRWILRPYVTQWLILGSLVLVGLVAILYSVMSRRAHATRRQRVLDIALHGTTATSGIVYVVLMYAHGRTVASVSAFILFVCLVLFRIAWTPRGVSLEDLAQTFD